MPEESNERLITVREAAQECGRNMETVRRWIWAGKLPAEKLGNQLFIRKSDLASYCRLPARSVPAKAGETAVRYRAEAETDFLERARAHSAGSGQALREPMKARGVESIDASEEIRKMREERMNELESRLRGNTNMRYETKDEKKEDFIERAIRFRSKLRTRGYPEVDTVALVKKSREGRMRELRQSLR